MARTERGPRPGTWRRTRTFLASWPAGMNIFAKRRDMPSRSKRRPSRPARLRAKRRIRMRAERSERTGAGREGQRVLLQGAAEGGEDGERQAALERCAARGRAGGDAVAVAERRRRPLSVRAEPHATRCRWCGHAALTRAGKSLFHMWGCGAAASSGVH
eukprot:1828172-Prymnesium_polylepis.3